MQAQLVPNIVDDSMKIWSQFVEYVLL